MSVESIVEPTLFSVQLVTVTTESTLKSILFLGDVTIEIFKFIEDSSHVNDDDDEQNDYPVPM